MPDAWDFSNTPRRPAAVAQKPMLTSLFCAVCCVVTLASLTSKSPELRGTFWDRLGHFGYAPATEIWAGHYAALVTSVFIHGDILHIAFNLIWFWRLGTILEMTMPPLAYVLFVVAAAAVGSCAELAVSDTTGIGASGIVYAMFGLLWTGRGAFAEWRAVATRHNLNLFLVWGVFCLVATELHFMNIANAAHFGGLLFGLAIGGLAYKPRREPRWAIPLAALLALCALSLFWLPWSPTWTFWKGNRAFEARQYRPAIAWYQRSLKRGGDAHDLWTNIGFSWQMIARDEATQGHADAERQAELSEMQAEEKAGPEPEDTTPEPASAPNHAAPADNPIARAAKNQADRPAANHP